MGIVHPGSLELRGSTQECIHSGPEMGNLDRLTGAEDNPRRDVIPKVLLEDILDQAEVLGNRLSAQLWLLTEAQ